jgi:hypothetical protein
MPLFVHRTGWGKDQKRKEARVVCVVGVVDTRQPWFDDCPTLVSCQARPCSYLSIAAGCGGYWIEMSVVRSKPFHEQRGSCCIAAGCGGYWIQRREVQAIPRPAGRLLHLRRKAEKNATTDHTRWCMQCRDGVFIIRSRQLYCFQEPCAPPARPKMSKMGKA